MVIPRDLAFIRNARVRSPRFGNERALAWIVIEEPSFDLLVNFGHCAP